MATVGIMQKFPGKWAIPIWADEPDTPTLWIAWDDQAPVLCQEYAEKVAALINKDDEAKEIDK